MDLASKPLVAVVWDDAHGKSTGDFTVEQLVQDFHTPAKYTSFGLLLIDNEKGVTICMEEADDGSFRGVTFIPRGMIAKVVKLGVPKERVKRKPKQQPDVETKKPEGI